MERALSITVTLSGGSPGKSTCEKSASTTCVLLTRKGRRGDQLIILAGGYDKGPCPVLAGDRFINSFALDGAPVFPMQPVFHDDWVAVTSGFGSEIALTADGSLWLWPDKKFTTIC